MHSFSFLLLSAVFWRSLFLFPFLYSISSTFSSSSSSPSFPFSILSLFLSFAYLLFLLLLTDRILVFSPSSSSSSSSSSLPRTTVGSQCILITENYDLWVRMGRGGHWYSTWNRPPVFIHKSYYSLIWITHLIIRNILQSEMKFVIQNKKTYVEY